ncbi:hypothetical protein N7G274_004927 [Stereocaulon virgatum]|uniref:Uncharacterized protein n=1 Tax=Stereocaulon virgatum TaxID=373712 RepID=A0ABR4ABF5_9LECA
MAMLIQQSARLVFKRSIQRQHNLVSPPKCQKATAADKSIDKPAQPRALKEKRTEAPTAKDNSPPPFPLPLWQRLGPVSDAFNAYGRTQKRRPWATQVGTSLIIYFCGDLAAQNIGDDDYNPWRTMRHLTIGAICSIPAYSWFMYLNRSFNYSSRLFSLATKVGVNQIVFTPVFNSYFFGMQSLLSGDTTLEAWERIKRTVPTSFINSCKLWPAVTAFSFTYIQPQYRALFAGVVAIGWQSYLSWLNQLAANEERAKKGLRPIGK